MHFIVGTSPNIMAQGRKGNICVRHRTVRVTHGVHFIDEDSFVQYEDLMTPTVDDHSRNKATDVETTVVNDHSTAACNSIPKTPQVHMASKVPKPKWSISNMKEAITCIEDKHMSLRGTSIKYGIPIASLRVWLMGATTMTVRGPCTILSAEEEDEVVQWWKGMAEIGYGLQISQLQSTISQII